MSSEDLVPGTAVLAQPELIRALAKLKPNRRDAWIDAYVLGRKQNSWQRDLAHLACLQLAVMLGSSDAIREAA